jgi:hypothetical protein
MRVFIAVAGNNEAELVHGSVWFGSPRLGSAILGTARRKHRFVYYCVIAGACFDVTILTWRKFATISFLKLANVVKAA